MAGQGRDSRQEDPGRSAQEPVRAPIGGAQDGSPASPAAEAALARAAPVAAGWLPVHWPLPGAGVAAAMTTRRGGVSTAGWAAADGTGGLNLGVACGDAAAAVIENRRRVASAFDRPVLWLRQIHGADVADGDVWAPGHPPPPADAAWTTRHDLALAVLVADCLPVLIADRQGRIVGAAHAGWRGLAAGVLPALVAAMRAQCPAFEPMAWLGPRIGQTAFEVGPEVRQAFLDRLPGAGADFLPSPRRGHFLCDLGTLARRDLRAAGVAQVADSGLCTQRERELFWSHRRDQPGGRMCALIRRAA